MLLDKGYDYAEVRAILQAHGLIAHIRSRGEEAKAKKKACPARRHAAGWSNAPTAWMNRFRSILTRWCKKERNYLGMLYFVCGLDLLPCRRIIRIGTKHLHHLRHRHHARPGCAIPTQPDAAVVTSVVSLGRTRKLDDDQILTALAVGLVESNLNNLE